MMGKRAHRSKIKNRPSGHNKKNKVKEQIMKQTHDINNRTQTGSVTMDAPAVLPVRHLQESGRGLSPKAGVIALLLGTGLLTAMGQANQPQYRFIAITVPVPSEALGINNSGLVTGAYIDPVTGGWSSFLLERGDLTTGIEIAGATDTLLGPANNSGVESGNFGDETHARPVFYDIRRGTYAPLPEIPGMPFNFGNGINDLGHGVGVAYASGDINAGGNGPGMNWFWDGTDYSFFTVPGATFGASVGGLNDRDQISGYYVDGTGTPRGFVKNGPNYTTLDAPGAAYTIGNGINNQGVVTGLYVNPGHSHHGFIWSKGQFITVDANVPGSIGTEWIGLNDHGDLAGIYFDASHAAHAVIALRVDEDLQN
jgi:hypothetical protein